MPLRPELRKFYGAKHRAYRRELIEIYGPRCMACGAVTLRYLNLAHTTHDPTAWSLVSLWCPSCHARKDAGHTFAVRRRVSARRVGQLWLWPEIEWACFPSWMTPRRVLREAQQRMFE
jgi:hypothetical protein